MYYNRYITSVILQESFSSTLAIVVANNDLLYICALPPIFNNLYPRPHMIFRIFGSVHNMATLYQFSIDRHHMRQNWFINMPVVRDKRKTFGTTALLRRILEVSFLEMYVDHVHVKRMPFEF